MLENILMISAAVSAFVEFVKSMLIKLSFFAALDEQTQSIVLQIVAFLAGVVAAFSWQMNAFPSADPNVGMVATGLIAATGASGIHVLLALFGIQGDVTAQAEHRVDTRPQDAGHATTRTFAPFM